MKALGPACGSIDFMVGQWRDKRIMYQLKVDVDKLNSNFREKDAFWRK